MRPDVAALDVPSVIPLPFRRALLAVRGVLDRYDGAKGSVWKQQHWSTHARHATAHGQTAMLAEDRGGEFADIRTELEHAATRALMALERYLEASHGR